MRNTSMSRRLAIVLALAGAAAAASCKEEGGRDAGDAPDAEAEAPPEAADADGDGDGEAGGPDADADGAEETEGELGGDADAEVAGEADGEVGFGPPTGLVAVPGDGIVLLAWDPVLADRYRVYRSETSGAGYAELAGSPVTETRFRDGAAVNGTTWYYVVTAVLGDEESAWSAEVAALPPDGTSAPPVPVGDEEKLTGEVLRFERLVEAGEDAAAAAEATGLVLTPEGRVRLTMWSTTADAAGLVADLEALGAERVLAAFDMVSADVAPDGLDAVAALPGVAKIGAPVRAVLYDPPAGEAVGEGVDVIGAHDLHARGVTGAGFSVAIIDGGFKDIDTMADLAGAVVFRWCPPGFTGPTGLCLAPDGSDRYQDPDGAEHGTAVAEIVHEIVPDADLYLYVPWTIEEFQAAVRDAVETQAVNVVTASLGYYDLDDYDGTAPVAQYVDGVAGSRAVVTVAMGNEARDHYLADFNDPGGLGFHDFGGATCRHVSAGAAVNVPCLPFVVRGGATGEVHLEWNEWDRSPWGTSTGPLSDLDVCIYRSTTSATGAIRCSTGNQAVQRRPTEMLWVTCPAGSTCNLWLSVRGGPLSGTPRLQLFLDGASWTGMAADQATTSISFTVPAATNVLGIAAVKYDTLAHLDYSSRGPTADGRAKPDLAGPSEVSSTPYGSAASGGFNGTSAATPHVAGAAALWTDWMWTAGGDDSPAGVQQALIDRAWLPDDARASVDAPATGCTDLAAAYGVGRVDVSPPVVFRGADGALYARPPVPLGTPDANPCDARTEAGLRTRLAAEGSYPAVSPDGLWVAFESSTSGAPEIWKVGIDGSDLTQLTSGGVSEASYQPTWSPDGARLAFTQRRRGINPGTGELNQAYNVKLMNADGTGQEFVTINDLALDDQSWAVFPSWSPAGDWIAFTWVDPVPGSGGARAQTYNLARIRSSARGFELRLADGVPFVEQLTVTNIAARPRYSPDGTMLLYHQIAETPLPTTWPIERTGNGRVYVMDLAGAAEYFCPFGNEASWSPSGSRFVMDRMCDDSPPCTDAGLWLVKVERDAASVTCDQVFQLTTDGCAGERDRQAAW